MKVRCLPSKIELKVKVIATWLFISDRNKDLEMRNKIFGFLNEHWRIVKNVNYEGSLGWLTFTHLNALLIEPTFYRQRNFQVPSLESFHKNAIVLVIDFVFLKAFESELPLCKSGRNISHHVGDIVDLVL